MFLVPFKVKNGKALVDESVKNQDISGSTEGLLTMAVKFYVRNYKEQDPKARSWQYILDCANLDIAKANGRLLNVVSEMVHDFAS